MDIGNRMKDLRILYGLTQQELADRSELSKGFISQMERNLTSPSVSTLLDIIQCLGTTPAEFFADEEPGQIVFKMEDYFEKENEEAKTTLEWIIPNAQKNVMEPVRLTLRPGGTAFSHVHPPHEGEEFGYVLKGAIKLYYGPRSFIVKQGESFYFDSGKKHYIEVYGSRDASLIWVASPPSF
ncbi:cupin domain-containing protein [Lachnospiraceae bacterium ZAX-1]